MLDDVIRASWRNVFARWSAADAFVLLVHTHKLGRDEAVERLREHLRWAMEHSDQEIISPLIDVLSNYAPREAMADIEQAYREGLVDQSIIALDEVREILGRSDAQMQALWDHFDPTGMMGCMTGGPC